MFLGDTEVSWLYQTNNYAPVKKAMQYFTDNKIGNRFNGALEVGAFKIVALVFCFSVGEDTDR